MMWVFWLNDDALNTMQKTNMQNTKKGHSMRKIVGIYYLGSTPCQLFSTAHICCAFRCIHNLSINVYAQHCHALYVLSTIALHWLHVTVEGGMSWKRYECAVNDCLATLKTPAQTTKCCIKQTVTKVLAHTIILH